jgi:hypothetical protein
MCHAWAKLPLVVHCSMHSGRDASRVAPSDKASAQRMLTWPEQLAVVAL